MDTLFQEFPNSINGLMFDHVHRNLHNGYMLNHNLNEPNDRSFLSINSQQLQSETTPSTSPSSSSSSSSSTTVTSSWPSSEGENPNSTAVLKYINDMLMEEDLECKNCMLQDCLALQAAEKSFYDVLNQDVGSPDHESSDGSSNSDAVVNTSVGTNFILDHPNLELSPASPLQDLEIYPFGEVKGGRGADFSVLEKNNGTSRDKGRKNHQREDSSYLELEERSNKHSATSITVAEPSEMLFDDVLLCQHKDKGCAPTKDHQTSQNGATEKKKGSNGRTNRTKKNGNKGDVVDLPNLLTQCAQAVSISDQRSATDLLKQIRQHSSPYGDGNQRLAHYFANGLETRLQGIRVPTYAPIISNRTSAAEILKAYQVYIKACPFKRMSNFYANKTILKLAKNASSLHIIDFGILYGFQWPCLIQRLSERPGGPPKIRITGIELPQPGFKPTERVEETGRRLKRYCERFHVPFEFNVIAQKWETINYEDLKIDADEMTVVNCLYRLRNLPDDTVVADSTRDKVLKLIKSIKPQIFIHGAVNGTYNAPFFLTRFREALYHFSSLYDMFEVSVPREDEERMMYEKEVYGKDAMNVIACEALERVERPETYKQWQARNLRAGFRPLPLDEEIFKQVRSTVKSEYNKDFVVDQDGQWMLQGWKGRIIMALSVWKPSF